MVAKGSPALALFLLAVFFGQGLNAQGNPPRKPPRVNTSCGKCDSSGRPLEIVNSGGKCLDVHKDDWKKDGALVQLWECKGDEPAQHWQWNGEAIVNGGGKCLEATAPTEADKLGGVRMWSCNGQPQQTWDLNGLSIVNKNGMCLDAHAATMSTDGGRVHLWTCVPDAAPQAWWFNPITP